MATKKTKQPQRNIEQINAKAFNNGSNFDITKTKKPLEGSGVAIQKKLNSVKEIGK